jgi:hypothetical protein
VLYQAEPRPDYQALTRVSLRVGIVGRGVNSCKAFCSSETALHRARYLATKRLICKITLQPHKQPMPISLPEFVDRWKASTLSERAAAHSHFIDLCEVLNHPRPAAVDQTGESFTFEKHVSTNDDSKGFADVWKRGFFGWEYKGKHRDLSAAYRQLLRYREDLENPPLLVTCDQDRFEVHTNFTRSRPQIYSFTLDDLASGKPTANCALPPIEVLRAVFFEPDLLRPEVSRARVTEAVAAEFAKLADNLEGRGVPSQSAAHFLMRLLFCLFADSIGLLPDHLFRQMIELDKTNPANFTRKLRALFAAMSNKGGMFGAHDIHWFDGGLFMDDQVFALDWRDMAVLQIAARLDWSQVEPAIFGTLFERSLDPGKRSQLGAHYTSAADISLVVEPVVMVPIEARWADVKAHALEIAAEMEKASGRAHTKLHGDLQECLLDWIAELANLRVLDPACGSGNFLYLALRRMLDMWHEARMFAADHALPTFVPKQVHPSQLFGLETNIYAQELASVVVWIGYLQWLHEHGMGLPEEPILRRLDNTQFRDAILNSNAEGSYVESEWPNTDFIIGNPPFLGGKRLRSELGDAYVDALFRVYDGRVPPEADLVTYWFEKARGMIEQKHARRVGLLATQGIRGGANRKVRLFTAMPIASLARVLTTMRPAAAVKPLITEAPSSLMISVGRSIATFIKATSDTFTNREYLSPWNVKASASNGWESVADCPSTYTSGSDPAEIIGFTNGLTSSVW